MFFFKDDYETLSSNTSALKLAHKNLRAEHKIVEEKLQAWLVAQDELQKMKDEIEKNSNANDTKDIVNENNKLKEECQHLEEEYKRLQTEYKMLQNIYKKLRIENNNLILKHTELQGETAEFKNQTESLNVEVSKLSNYCQTLAQTYNSLESQTKSLITNMFNLVGQQHDVLNEISNSNEKKLSLEKMHDLLAKREKIEKMMKDYDYDVIVEKKKVAITAPNVVRQIHKSNNDLRLSKNHNENSKDHKNANFPDPEEVIYGKIWEAGTPPLNNTAILRPIMSHSSSSSSSSSLQEQLPLSDEKIRNTNFKVVFFSKKISHFKSTFFFIV